MSPNNKQSIQHILNKQFLLRSILPIALFGIILLTVVYLFNTYQREQTRNAVATLTQDAFSEIAMQTALNINRQFTENQNALYQLSKTLQLLIKYKNKLNLYKSTWIQRDGFFINKKFLFKDNKTPVYSTNLTQLNSDNIETLNILLHLTPIVKACVDIEDDLINAAWINIGKYYSLSYPIINPVNELRSDLDVTQYPFYYLANTKNNPKKHIVFTSLYQEEWAINAGELGAYLMPIYVNKTYSGVIGFTLTADAIAQTIEALKLPYNAYAMLVDKEGYLIASSDNQRSHDTFGIASFFELHNNKNLPNRQLMKITPTASFNEDNIVHTQSIKGTDFKLIICASKRDVFKTIDAQNSKALQLGLGITSFLILLYLFFIQFTKKSISRLSTTILNTVKETLDFSTQMGENEKLAPVHTDITEFQELGDKLYTTHQKLRDLINKDPQTSLFNLYQLKKDIHPDQEQSLMRLQITNYHHLFNLYGQESIQSVITTLATALSTYENMTPYRIHENEFALLVNHHDATLLESVFQAIISLEFNYNAIALKPLIHSGIAMTHPLLEESGIALLEAERSGTKTRSVTCKETSKTKHKFLENLAWATRVEHAFSEDLFVPYFQPIYDLEKNVICKFEALVRLQEGEEIISPYLFLQAIDDIGKSHHLTRLMVEKVFAVARNFPDISFNINISFKDLYKPDFLAYITTQTQTHQVAPENITFELLENEAMHESDDALKVISALKQKGFKIAIDDFGTGHSNFAHLMSMRVDYIKVDGQFIKNIIKDPNSVTITKTIAQFASLVHAQTVAEFVSDVAIIKRVRQLGINYIQGYAISPPLPEEQLSLILKKDFSYAR